jgi:YceG-like family
VPRSEDRRGAQRTAAEREAARIERERRRATRRGEPTRSAPAAAPVDAIPPAVLPEPPQAVAPTATQAVAVAEDEAPAAEDEAPAEIVDREEPAEVAENEAPARAADVTQQAAPPPTANGAAGANGRRRVVAPRRGRVRRAERHSLRARAGALVALALVAVALWGVVMLVRHLRRSGTGGVAVSRPPVVKVLIPEGETRAQIAAIARRDGLRGDYLGASTRSPGLQPRRFGAPAGTPSLEGFLFPATYQVRRHGSVSELVADQLEAFHERFGPQLERRARALALTSYQLLTVASMVEREALLPHDRPLVAAVIYNRLHLRMPLGIDATIRYALNDFEKPLTEAQLQTPSPYNTRLHVGLPPTPISNPGMEAIEAAAHPAHAAYLFYVDGADGCGELVFSNTEAQFEANKAAYDEALRVHGGRLPACRRR